MRASRLLIAALLGLAATVASSCKDTTGPTTGEIVVSVTATGVEVDADFNVSVDGGASQIVGANAPTSFINLTPGSHSLRLGGVAANCAVSGANPRTAVVVAGTITEVAFAVTCMTTTGSVRVTAITSGLNLDSDGYTVILDGIARGPVPANGTVTIDGIASGVHTVSLDGVAPNCAISSANAQLVPIAAGVINDVFYPITCRSIASIRVTAATSGVDPDPDGYVVKVTRPPFVADANLGINGMTIFSGLTPGDHLVTLEGFADNCDVTTPNPRTVTALSSDTVDVSFQIVCAPVTLLAFVNADRNIAVVNSNGTNVRTINNDPALDEDPAWSPDRLRIAFMSERDGSSGQGQAQEIYVMNADGSSPQRLTSSLAANYQPAWSPDGSRIAFVSERDGNAEIYVMNADGTNPVRLTNHDARDSDPAWSPDGTRIAFTSFRDPTSNAGIYVMSADGSGVLRLTASSESDQQPAWSPDGTKLTFARRRCDSSYLCYPVIAVAQADGSGVTTLVMGQQPAWSPDGGTIAYTALDCNYYYYYYYGCQPAGIGIISPNGTNNHLVVTTFAYGPAWRP